MRTSTALGASLVGLVAVGLSALPTHGSDDPSAALFAERCASCHTLPDPAMEADRVWAGQVRRTA